MWKPFSRALPALLASSLISAVLLASPASAVSEKCCEEIAPFGNDFGSKEVCAIGDLPFMDCFVSATWRSANRLCKEIGARLCSRKELKNGEGLDETDCGWGNTRVWTRNKCNGDPTVRVAARVRNGKGKKCLPRNDDDATAAVLCCADSCTANCNTAKTATYEVSVTSFWREDPAIGSEHFSPFVGWAHDGSDEGRLWNLTFTATKGVEKLAEAGATARILTELSDLEDLGLVRGPERKSGSLFTPFFLETWRITVDRERPWASHISMIAPSPDWFVGNHVNLMGDDGVWMDSTGGIDFGQYDAGTEDGDGFSTSNPATDPQGVITTLLTELNGGAGDIRFDLQSCE